MPESREDHVPYRSEVRPDFSGVGYAFYDHERCGALDVEVEIGASLWELMALLGPDQEATVYLSPECAQEVLVKGDHATMATGWLHRARPSIAIVRRPETPETGRWPASGIYGDLEANPQPENGGTGA